MLAPIAAPTAEEAARLRALFGLRTPDALQAAVAVARGADTFYTNDSSFKRVTELRSVVLLDDMA